MRKKLRMSFMIFSEHIGMYILLLIQVMIPLFGGNLLLASYQQQSLLEKPFAEMLQFDGYYLPERAFSMGSVLDDNSQLSKNDLTEDLQGEKEVFRIYSGQSDITYTSGVMNTTIVVYEDSFWQEYQPILKQGKWFAPEKDTEIPLCITTPNCPDNEIYYAGKEIHRAGIMSDSTYIPTMQQWNKIGGIQKNLYKIFHAENADTIYLLMPCSQWKKLGFSKEDESVLITPSAYVIVMFTTPLTEEQNAYNMSIFQEYAHPEIALSEFREQIKTAKNDTIRRYLPLVAAFSMITIFGIFCVMAIHFFQDMKTYSVCYLCGMKWNTCVLLSLLQLAILLCIVFLFSICAFFILRISGITAELGLRFTANNLVFTLLFLLFVLLIGGLLPMLLIRHRTPLTLLRR